MIMPSLSPPSVQLVQRPKPTKKRRKTKKRNGVGAKCTILLHALHPKALVDEKYSKGSHTNREQLSDCLMMEQFKRKAVKFRTSLLPC